MYCIYSYSTMHTHIKYQNYLKRKIKGEEYQVFAHGGLRNITLRKYVLLLYTVFVNKRKIKFPENYTIKLN